MKVSLSWLAEYVPIKMSASELAEALTLMGSRFTLRLPFSHAEEPLPGERPR